MPKIRINAPAKLNLHLNIGEKRPDGFHEIQSLFCALDYGDTLSFETDLEKTPFPSEDTEIIMDWQLPWGGPKDLPPDKNIVKKAVSLFRKRTGFDKKLKIVIEKRIPLGGGLGGGSSDAAATLLALNRLVSDGALTSGALTSAALAEMGASLGSDVPFFLQTALSDTPVAWVSGRGELVRPLAMPPQLQGLSLVLVNPGIPSDTAKAFRLLDEYRGGQGGGVAALGSGVRGVYPSIPSLQGLTTPDPLLTPHSSLLTALSGPPKDWPFVNDFFPVFEAGFKQKKTDGGLFSAYREIISALNELGADFSTLSGSGSTCFGVFTGRDMAKTAKKLLLKQWNLVIETFYLRSKQLGGTI